MFIHVFEVGLQSRMLDNIAFQNKLCPVEAALPELFKALNLEKSYALVVQNANLQKECNTID